MFLGEAVCLIFYAYTVYRQKRTERALLNINVADSGSFHSLDKELQEGEQKVSLSSSTFVVFLIYAIVAQSVHFLDSSCA